MSDDQADSPATHTHDADYTEPEDKPQDVAVPKSDDPQVIDLDDHTITYDLSALEDFLSRVFHVERLDDEHVMTWATHRGPPGYPKALAQQRLRRQPRALYYGTSTAKSDPELGVRNRRSQFCRLHVVVLDDIGTKIPLDRIPEPLAEPSYVIETSEGNFQYGYILSTPINSLDRAQALIQLLYDSGLTDSGGALAMKLVRLPGGVNGKPQADKQQWPVRLTSATWRHWTPDELLEGAKCSVKWADIEDDPTEALRRPEARSVTPWAHVTPQAPNLDGTIDPVLEWLYEEKHVAQDTGEWVTVRCPQAALHSTGDEVAYYSPLGRGDDKWALQRGFNCFHDHCSEFHTRDFLHWVLSMGGPAAAVFDTSTRVSREWVYDPVDDVCYQAFGARRFANGVKLAPLKNVYHKKVRVPTHNGEKLISEVEAWLQSDAKVLVDGVVMEPSTTAPLVTCDDGELRFNTFKRPDWSQGDAFEDDVETFLEFIEYLIPIEEERTFFLDWLAAKYQNMAFRGPAIVMVATSSGTGRGTLAKLLTILFGDNNIATVPFCELIGGREFNEWQMRPLAITNETLDTGDTAAFFRAYERLKTIVETQPTHVRVNRKNREARMMPVYTSHMLFSNHERALIVENDDRRFYIITNVRQPAAPAYFTRLYRWMHKLSDATGKHEWAPAVADYLMERKVDTGELLAPAPMTQGKAIMLEAGQTPLDRLLRALIDNWEGSYISQGAVRKLIGSYAGMFGLHHGTPGNQRLQRVLERYSVSTELRYRDKDHKQHRVRLLKHCSPPRKKMNNAALCAYVERNVSPKLQELTAELASELG